MHECARLRKVVAEPRVADTSTPLPLEGLPPLPAPTPGTMPPNEARAMLEEAMADRKSGHWEEAHEYFTRAFALHPSRKLLEPIAESAEHTDRPGDAIDAYELLLADGELDEEKRAEIETRLAAVKATTATLVLRGLTTGVEFRDTLVVSPTERREHRHVAEGPAGILRVVGGRHVLRTTGLVHSDPWEVDVAAGSTTEHDFVPTLPDFCR